MRQKTRLKVFGLGAILFFFGASLSQAFAQNSANRDRFLSMNEFQKKEFICSITSQESITGRTNSQQEIAAILGLGLVDESPIVAEQAIQQIGAMKLRNNNTLLIGLYKESRPRFKGYAERIQLAIITALGQTADTTSIKLLGDILKTDNGTVIGEKTLLALQALDNNSIANEVNLYAEKMNSLVQKGKDLRMNPLIFANALRNAQLAQHVLRSFKKEN